MFLFIFIAVIHIESLQNTYIDK